jgi:hypothetical protein
MGGVLTVNCAVGGINFWANTGSAGTSGAGWVVNLVLGEDGTKGDFCVYFPISGKAGVSTGWLSTFLGYSVLIWADF